MALYDVNDLISRSTMLLNRPTPDEAFTVTTANDVWISFLSDAQTEVNERIATYCPDIAYGPPVKLTTSDGGLTYAFGNDADGNPIVPLGQLELRTSPRGVFILPGNDWDNTTEVYLLDSDANGLPVVRWPGQRAKTFGDGPYARYMTPTRHLTSTASVVTLKPFTARKLIPYRALVYAAKRIEQDPQPFVDLYESQWTEWLFSIQKQQFGSGLRSSAGGSNTWWNSSSDLGRSGY